MVKSFARKKNISFSERLDCIILRAFGYSKENIKRTSKCKKYTITRKTPLKFDLHLSLFNEKVKLNFPIDFSDGAMVQRS